MAQEFAKLIDLINNIIRGQVAAKEGVLLCVLVGIVAALVIATRLYIKSKRATEVDDDEVEEDDTPVAQLSPTTTIMQGTSLPLDPAEPLSFGPVARRSILPNPNQSPNAAPSTNPNCTIGHLPSMQATTAEPPPLSLWPEAYGNADEDMDPDDSPTILKDGLRESIADMIAETLAGPTPHPDMLAEELPVPAPSRPPQRRSA